MSKHKILLYDISLII